MKKLILLISLCMVGIMAVYAQGTVSGKVTDATGEPLPGASVLVKGTTTGTVTDINGDYTLGNVPSDATLVYSFVGMQDEETAVNGRTSISISLQESTQLEEVVVTGYGVTTKKSYTGSVKSVTSDKLVAKNISNISQSLIGESAGVNVISTSGQPGSIYSIRIRGFGSVNGNRAPLYVVDGLPLGVEDGSDYGAINSIASEDIESLVILKDATATAIYGARGANGVILITTKKGRTGFSIETNVKTGTNSALLPRYDIVKSPEEYIELSWHAMANRRLDIKPDADDWAEYANTYLFSSRGIDSKYNLWDVENVSELIDPATGKVRSGVRRKYNPENWEDYGFQNSNRTEVSLKMSGGNDKTNFFSSFNYLNDIGYNINTSYKRYSARLNVNHKPRTWLSAGANMLYSYSTQKRNGQSEDSGSVFWFVDNIPSIFPLFLRDENGDKIADDIFGGYQYDYGVGRGFGALTNAISDAHKDLIRTNEHGVTGVFYANFDLGELVEGLSFENKYGVNFRNAVSDFINNPFYGSAAGNKGSLFKRQSHFITQNILNLLRYKNTFDDIHTVEILAAHEANKYIYSTSTASKSKVVNLENGLDVLNNYVVTSSPAFGYTNDSRLESYFTQMNYDFDRKYFLSFSYRQDGSSRFANNKWGTFGSVGVGWILTEESFAEKYDFIDFLKLKASYGLTGDQAGVGVYAGQNTYSINNLNDEISLGVRAIQNPDITWETSKMFQVGIEFELFDNLLEGGIDYYIKNTEDLIFSRRIGPSTGDALIQVNDGKLRNQGIEFDLTAHILDEEDYKLDFSINGEFLKTKLVDMPIDPSTGEQKIIDINGRFGRAVGKSLFDFYVREWAGVEKETGDPLWTLHYVDANNNDEVDDDETKITSLYEFKAENPTLVNQIATTTTSVYTDATRKYIGKSAIPTVRGGFRINASYKNFYLSSQFVYSLGGYGYDFVYAQLMDNEQVGGNNWHKDIHNSWKKDGDLTDVPKLISNRNTRVASSSSRFITSSNYFGLSNIKLGYSFPNKILDKAKISSADIWLSGDNLMLKSKRKGFNPTTSESGTSDWYTYSPLSTFTLGLNVTF